MDCSIQFGSALLYHTSSRSGDVGRTDLGWWMAWSLVGLDRNLKWYFLLANFFHQIGFEEASFVLDSWDAASGTVFFSIDVHGPISWDSNGVIKNDTGWKISGS